TDVPVFRYALERWPSAPFSVTVVMRDASHKKAAKAYMKTVEAALWDDAGHDTNAKLFLLVPGDEETTKDFGELTTQILAAHPKENLMLALVTPSFTTNWGEPDMLWSAPANAAAIKTLRESVVRQEIARLILSGESAVMLVDIPKGRDANDPLVLKLLKLLKGFPEQLELPERREDPRAQSRGRPSVGVIGPKLRISFPLLKMTAANKEPILRSLLAYLDYDPKKEDPKNAKDVTDNPIKLYAVFGQGRALGPLIEGYNLDEETLLELCQFICGPCSCTVKAENPGLDLFMPIDWLSFLDKTYVIDKELPPLPGAGALLAIKAKPLSKKSPAAAIDVSAQSKAKAGALSAVSTTKEPNSNTAILVSVVAIAIAVIAGTVFVLRREEDH
ncbi:MAG: hypothetical protein HRT89_08685, partial [Lentisphaeria bacterium]|nr:hypothetical protein [Lentisphaeria bacterium]